MSQTPTTSPPSGQPAKDACTMAMLAHLLGIVTAFWGSLIIWLIKKDSDPFINDQAKEALNFQITVAIAWIVSSILIPAFGLGCILLPIVGIGNLILCIMAAMKANSGEQYRYPFALRLIK